MPKCTFWRKSSSPVGIGELDFPQAPRTMASAQSISAAGRTPVARARSTAISRVGRLTSSVTVTLSLGCTASANCHSRHTAQLHRGATLGHRADHGRHDLSHAESGVHGVGGQRLHCAIDPPQLYPRCGANPGKHCRHQPVGLRRGSRPGSRHGRNTSAARRDSPAWCSVTRKAP